MNRSSNSQQNTDKIDEFDEDLDRFTLLGKFASILFHEIGSSLCKMKMNLDVYKEAFVNNDELKKIYQTFQTEIIRLNKLSNEVKQFSRKSEVIPAKVNISLFFESIREQVSKKLRDKGISFKNNALDYSIISDYSRLQTAFLCLINSSIDSMGNDGTIEIASDLLDEIGKLSLRIRAKGNDLDIFDPFKKYDINKITESGLSLLIFKQLIMDLGGSVNLLSSDNEAVYEVKLSCDLDG